MPRKDAYFDVEGHIIFLPDQDTFERESGFKIGKKMFCKHNPSVLGHPGA